MLIGHSMSDANGHLIAIDPMVCEIMQRSERELIGMSYADLTHPDDRARNVAIVQQMGILDGPVKIRKRYVRPDGSAVWADVKASRLRVGDVDRLVGTIELVMPKGLARGPESLWHSAKRVHLLIQRRRRELGDDLFSDHAWIILLQIYLAEAEGRVIDITEIAERGDLRPEPVARWIRVLEQRRMVDRFEWRECAAQLTAQGIAKIERLLDWSLDD